MNDAITPNSTRKLIALVVEDELYVRDLICEVLQDVGIDPVPLETADEGFAFLQENAVDIAIVVLDVRTPGRLDGLELASLAQARWPQLPVLLTSGYTGKNVPIPKGAVFLPKPWTIDTFIQTVNTALQRAGNPD